MSTQPDPAVILRQPFAPEQIGKLPKISCRLLQSARQGLLRPLQEQVQGVRELHHHRSRRPRLRRPRRGDRPAVAGRPDLDMGNR